MKSKRIPMNLRTDLSSLTKLTIALPMPKSRNLILSFLPKDLRMKVRQSRRPSQSQLMMKASTYRTLLTRERLTSKRMT
jgi:hypothetical protein